MFVKSNKIYILQLLFKNKNSKIITILINGLKMYGFWTRLELHLFLSIIFKEDL